MSPDTVSIKNLSQESKSFYILLGRQISLDTIATALGVYGQLKAAGKAAFVASPNPVKIEEELPFLDQITQEIGNRNLVISLKLPNTEIIDKVSYNINEEDKTFNLVVQPKADADPLKANDVKYSYTGAEADTVILLGARSMQDFGHFYEEEKKLFDEATTIELTRNPGTKFATHQFTADGSSLAEVGYQFLKEIGINDIGSDVATNFLAGIDSATQNLQHPSIRPETFETVAQLVRSGGSRIPLKSSNGLPPAPSPFSRPPGTMMTPPAGGSGVPQEWLTPKVFKGSKNQKS